MQIMSTCPRVRILFGTTLVFGLVFWGLQYGNVGNVEFLDVADAACGDPAVTWPVRMLSGQFPLLGTDGSEAFAAYINKNILTKLPAYSKWAKNHDYKSVADVRNSMMMIQDNTRHYALGDVITVVIQLRDSYNRTFQDGGDLLRIWMAEESQKASVGGYVIDYGNGIYLGVVEALWAGNPEINIAIANRKEHIGVYTGFVTRNGAYYKINAIFQDGSNVTSRETTFCTAWPDSYIYKGLQVCNMTDRNYNMSFYCVKPKRFSCNDWDTYSFVPMDTILDSTTLSHLLYHHNRTHSRLPSIRIQVTEDSDGRQRVLSPPEPCNIMNTSRTWNSRVPSGYFYGSWWDNSEKWTSLQCTQTVPMSSRTYAKCLKNRPVIAVGDSTLRLFIVDLIKFVSVSLGEDIDNKAWHQLVHATSEQRGINIEWMPHEHPFAGRGSRRQLRSLSSRINEIGPGSNAIILVHWYLHFALYLDHKLYREHVRNAKEAIVQLLKRSPNVQIFIKGPHATLRRMYLVPYDYVAKYMEQILYEEFRELQSSVVYLNYWDMTVGNGNCKPHPPVHINAAMVHNFMSIACMKLG